jgi:hypothetical protein
MPAGGGYKASNEGFDRIFDIISLLALYKIVFRHKSVNIGLLISVY